MKNIESLLIGNGLIIEYGGSDYINNRIIERTIENARIGKYEADAKKNFPPEEAYSFFKLIKKEIRDTIKGCYDEYAYFETEKNILKDFKERYPSDKININNVGFEDYFLVLRLIYNKFKESSETRIGASTMVKRLFLDSIYNDGNINTIYTKFPPSLCDFMQKFDKVFTTNYDNNLEFAIDKQIYHLHGQFDVLENPYDKNSFRNKMPDKPADRFNIEDKWKHIYCNALMDFSKDFAFNMYTRANDALEKFVNYLNTNEEFADELGQWKDSDNSGVKNISYAITLKKENPDSKMEEYPVKEFKEISDRITIIGFSPSNDTHLFKLLNLNEKLSSVVYYYFTDNERTSAQRVLPDKKVKCLPVKELWKSFI